MSGGAYSTVTAIFTDTSVLYNFCRGELEEADTLFKNYSNLEKVTSKFGHDEFEKVATRRAEAYRAWEEAISEDKVTVGDYQFTTPTNLKGKDLDNLNELQEELVKESAGKFDALRKINARLRQYENGVERVFGETIGEVLVSVEDVTANEDLLNRFKLDIHNHNDRRLLADAVEWYNSGGEDTFVTSDTNDFFEKTDGGTTVSSTSELPGTLAELGRAGGSLQDDINDHIENVYTGIDHIRIEELVKFVKSY